MYITDDEFIAAQDIFASETDETAALSIVNTIFWPYLSSLAFCTTRKILARNGVLSMYSIEDIDSIAKDVVCIIARRYIDSWHGRGSFYKRHHAVYRKDKPKAMVWLACIKMIYREPVRVVPLGSIEDIVVEDSWEDKIIEKIDNERAARE